MSPGNKPDGDPSSNAADHPIFVDGFGGSAEDIERQWFDKVYTGRGDRMRQLTWRAVLMGAMLGGVLSLTNLYIGLKAGWAFGVAITACILSWATWTSLLRIGLARTPMTISRIISESAEMTWSVPGSPRSRVKCFSRKVAPRAAAATQA